MTEMAHGTIVVQSGEAVLPRWWRTVDRVTIGCVLALFAIGILLGFAASPPLAERNGHEPFHYVIRQFAFGGLALTVMVLVSMMSPTTVRRLGVLGFFAAHGGADAAADLRHRLRAGGGALVLARLRLGAAVGIPQARLRRLHRLDDRGLDRDRRAAGQDGVAGGHHDHRRLPRACSRISGRRR
jgi:hypothetical protein